MNMNRPDMTEDVKYKDYTNKSLQMDSNPVTMKAAVVHEFGKPLVIEEVPIPVPGNGQILVKVEACGVCHTDLHAANGDWPVNPILPSFPATKEWAMLLPLVPMWNISGKVTG